MEIGRNLVQETQKRLEKKEAHAQEEALISVVKNYDLVIKALSIDGSLLGLIANDGSEWAMIVKVFRGDLITFTINTDDGTDWTPSKLFLAAQKNHFYD